MPYLALLCECLWCDLDLLLSSLHKVPIQVSWRLPALDVKPAKWDFDHIIQEATHHSYSPNMGCERSEAKVEIEIKQKDTL